MDMTVQRSLLCVTCFGTGSLMIISCRIHTYPIEMQCIVAVLNAQVFQLASRKIYQYCIRQVYAYAVNDDQNGWVGKI